LNITQDLNNELSRLESENKDLKSDIDKLKKKKTRYYNIFKNSSVPLWEEDFSEAYSELKKLPCKTTEEFSNYLKKDSQLLHKLIKTIKILDINDATVKLHEAENKQILLSSLDDIFSDESTDTLRDQFAALASGAYEYKCETTGRKVNGEKFHVLLTAFFPDNKGKTVFVTTIDISDRIDKEKEQAKLLKETKEKKKYSTILMDLTFELASKIDQNDILDSILKQIGKIVPYSSANIMLIKNNTLTVARHRGYKNFGAADFMTNFAEKIASEGIGNTFRKSNQIHIIDDTKSYPNWKLYKETKHVNSLLSMPIEWQGSSLGILNLDSNKKNSFTIKDAEKLKPIIYAATISIQKARLFEQIEKDISERKRTEENLRMALKEKEILLQEIHHRVKNNLTIIIALINLQDTKLTNQEEIVVFEELNQRIHSIALVHEKLYENHNLTNIDFYNYTTDLINSIQAVLVYRKDTEFKINIPNDIYFSLDKLIPLGLIINELITNSLKYAFHKSGGVISISLFVSKTDQLATLKITDNGVGYPEKNINGDNEQLGLLLVNSLIEQIKGSVKFYNKNGAVVIINIPFDENNNDR